MILIGADYAQVGAILSDDGGVIGAELTLESANGSRITIELDADLAGQIGPQLTEVGLKWRERTQKHAITIMNL